MELPEVPLQALFQHFSFTDVTVDAFSEFALFGYHEGTIKFLD